MWMNRNAAVNPMYGPYTVSSDRHRDEEDAPEPRRDGIIKAPQYQPTAGQIPDYTAVHTSSVPAEPRSHQGVRRNPSMGIRELHAVHSQDYGMANRRSRASGPTRFAEDAWKIPLTQDMPGTPAARGAGGRPDLVRDLNAFPENNPPKDMYNGHGWRRSWWQKTWFTHDYRGARLRPRFRVHAIKAAAPRPNIPSTQKSIYDGTSWGTLDRSRRKLNATPRMRRQPGFIDEALVQDRWDRPQASVVDVM
jgi:hypothetical protein